MKFKIEIDTANAAFGEGIYETGAELAQILRRLASKLENEGCGQYDTGSLRDVNGNKVGSYNHG